MFHVGTSRSELHDKARHLAEIHKAEPRHWPQLVQHMLDKSWSVRDTKHYVGRVREFNITEEMETYFLPLDKVVKRFLETGEFSPATVKKLDTQAQRTLEMLSASPLKGHYVVPYIAWLTQGVEDYAWDLRQLIKKDRELLLELEARDNESSFYVGDWREHSATLQDNSVALLLTDPPYGVAYQSDHRLDRREPRRHETIRNDSSAAGSAQELQDCLIAALPKLRANAHVLVFCHWRTEQLTRAAVEAVGLTVRGSLIWVKNNTGMGDPNTTFAPKHERIIHAVKGSPTLYYRMADVIECDRVSSALHPTEKPLELLSRLIEVTTVEGELVADPFAGVASGLLAAKISKRGFWGCEIDAQYHGEGLKRLK